MQHIPANANKAEIWPVSLQNQPGSRSISDDDLCYRPGELSLYRLSVADGIWPSQCDADGYAQSCPQLRLNALPADITSR